VFSYSMSGPAFASAIDSGLAGCNRVLKHGATYQRGTADVLWFGMSSPFGGSEAAQLAGDMMSGLYRSALGPIPSPLMKFLWMGYAGAQDHHSLLQGSVDSMRPAFVAKTNGVPNRAQAHCNTPVVVAYAASNPSYKCVELQSIGLEYMSGAECSSDPSGLRGRTFMLGFDIAKFATKWIGKWAAAQPSTDTVRAPYRSSWLPGGWNDFVTPTASCLLPGRHNTAIPQDPAMPFYVARINHDDPTCNSGQSEVNLDQKPCDWVLARVKQAAVTAGIPTGGGSRFMQQHAFESDQLRFEQALDVDLEEDHDQHAEHADQSDQGEDVAELDEQQFDQQDDQHADDADADDVEQEQQEQADEQEEQEQEQEQGSYT